MKVKQGLYDRTRTSLARLLRGPRIQIVQLVQKFSLFRDRAVCQTQKTKEVVTHGGAESSSEISSEAALVLGPGVELLDPSYQDHQGLGYLWQTLCKQRGKKVRYVL